MRLVACGQETREVPLLLFAGITRPRMCLRSGARPQSLSVGERTPHLAHQRLSGLLISDAPAKLCSPVSPIRIFISALRTALRKS